ncbi:uncharacterized protein RCC_03515 [Ramularia collo-cygni]|uniref:Uncharacterized protein n=1 Tax=Ramularia collo-cygni TaxID=112498 RepID=A0A2D3USC9_9PEZI|nr:uncharacterized protein RCC_03515 [Ramularia collo-cygni]CZT17678.1 uncharacterized protein RCC_03515 [Ramularia collo-cygni]
MSGLLPRDHFASRRSGSHAAPPVSYRDPSNRGRDPYTTPPPSRYASAHSSRQSSTSPFDMARTGLSSRSGSQSFVHEAENMTNPFVSSSSSTSSSSRYPSTSSSSRHLSASTSSRYPSTSSSDWDRRSQAAARDPYHVSSNWGSQPSSRSSSADWNRPPHYDSDRTPRASISSNRYSSTSSSHPAYTDPAYIGPGWSEHPSSSRSSIQSSRLPSIQEAPGYLPDRRTSFFERRNPSVDLYSSRYQSESSRRL